MGSHNGPWDVNTVKDDTRLRGVLGNYLLVRWYMGGINILLLLKLDGYVELLIEPVRGRGFISLNWSTIIFIMILFLSINWLRKNRSYDCCIIISNPFDYFVFIDFKFNSKTYTLLTILKFEYYIISNLDNIYTVSYKYNVFCVIWENFMNSLINKLCSEIQSHNIYL